ncbi:MAG: putative O-glycosylation ligase, exosortase A system-associated [Methylomonas sp.]|jgi:probable O-glycosylation ligase (exosortase A-associated)|uniref:putative O-glycosylation ligase, exosortase A system-associated n=1 Tax=Methylomonas sp. TaxID=418 RepID=UPI0025CD9DF0|nr:putative O-glycosylation ligase, exosortase A system-associated [Methylomonas sp.]MCK9606078.1 putative O-glycosylation ligase, exosortase A system-associated [Methylomonas sp.]
MRDLLITLIVLTGCFYTLKRPYIGILLWSWLSYMNPHRLAYGFAYSMPFAQITAITLIGSMIFSKDTRKLPINSLTIIWIIFVLFMGVTTIFAFYPESALKEYERIVKIQLIVFFTMMLITDMEKMKQLIWVIALSIGYFSVKGGAFTIATAGHYRVWGPDQSFIADNNSLAVAVLMTIPLMIYLYQISNKKWIKLGLLAASVLSLFTIIGSNSRGAFLAIAAVGLSYWRKSEHKFLTGVIVVAITAGLLAFAPESWYERMNTMENYEEDASSMGRLNAWEYAYNAANHNLLGVGLNSWAPETFALYAPNPLDVHAAHSIYFSVLADHGWIGLFMFLLIFYLSWRKLKNLIKSTANNLELKEIHMLVKMLQVSLIAYLVGGAFLSLSYFDLPWHIVGFVVILNRIVEEQVDSENSIQASVKTSKLSPRKIKSYANFRQN